MCPACLVGDRDLSALCARVTSNDRGEESGAYAPLFPRRQTGMPSMRALSARLAEMPEPGQTMTPIGRISSIRSLRLNGAALPWRVHSGLKTICGALRLSAQQAAMRSAPFGD